MADEQIYQLPAGIPADADHLPFDSDTSRQTFQCHPHDIINAGLGNSTVTLAVNQGGTGDTTFTAYAVICAGTVATGPLQNVSGVGTSGQVLTSNGAGSLPTWQSAASGTPGGADLSIQYNNDSVFGGAAGFSWDDVNLTLTVNPAARTSGSPNLVVFTAPADTTLTLSTESTSLLFDMSAIRQFATGALATQREFLVKAPTYAFVGASTITTACTLEISGAPIAGTNAGITKSYALRIFAGANAGVPLALVENSSSQTGHLLSIQQSNGTEVAYFAGQNDPQWNSGVLVFGAANTGVAFSTGVSNGIIKGATAAFVLKLSGNLDVGFGDCYMVGNRTRGFTYGFRAGACDVGQSSVDTAFESAAALVMYATDGQGNNNRVGWLSDAGTIALASAFTDATGTLTATNLSVTVIAGRTYQIEGYLIVSNSTSTDGSQFDFGGGTATATTFDVALLNVGSVAGGTQTATSLTGVLNYTTNTGTDRVYVRGYLKVNAGGTIKLRAATNTHVAGTMTLAAGSWLRFSDTLNL